jgi:hypothetical protein
MPQVGVATRALWSPHFGCSKQGKARQEGCLPHTMATPWVQLGGLPMPLRAGWPAKAWGFCCQSLSGKKRMVRPCRARNAVGELVWGGPKGIAMARPAMAPPAKQTGKPSTGGASTGAGIHAVRCGYSFDGSLGVSHSWAPGTGWRCRSH